MTLRTLAVVLGSAALVCASGGLQAQTVYRSVGPDGKITFSDKAPASAERGTIVSTGAGASGAAGNAALPFELRQVVAKYPVTLYASTPCGACDAGRALLTARGVPFSERSITTAEDSDYFQRTMGETSLPVLNIGSQRLKGFSDGEWVQYLDAAGYPKVSQLPAAFKNAPPTPLVNLQKAPAPPKAVDKPAAEPAPRLQDVNPANPAGIQF